MLYSNQMKRFLGIILIIPIRIYKLLISPLLPPSCIYHPSCSSYCIEGIKTHGPFRGFLYGLLRILRCSPFFKGGYDPISEPTTIKKQFGKFREFRRKEKI